jgi:hypothetical protein
MEIGKLLMQQTQDDYKTKNIYIADLPENVSEKDIVGFIIWVGPVYEIKFPLHHETRARKDYVAVKLFRPVSIKSALSTLRNKTLKGKKVIVAADFLFDSKDYSDIRNTLAELLPRKNGVDFVSADSLLLNVLKAVPDNKIYSRKPRIIQELGQYARSGIELSEEIIISIITNVQKPKTEPKQKTPTKNVKKRVKKKRSKNKKMSGVIIISTPMGGQPPKKRR